MSLSKQIKANRKNAQKSTGPKTEPGKRISSKNAMKFGITTDDIIINSACRTESQEDYDELLDNLKMELKPHSALQEYIVKIIADCCWRYRRVIAAETGRVNLQLDKIKKHPFYKKASTDQERDTVLRALLATEQIPYSGNNYNLHRYERRLQLQLDRAYRLLYKLQMKGQERYAERLAEKLEKKGITAHTQIPPESENANSNPFDGTMMRKNEL